jgi:hypothetical protein
MLAFMCTILGSCSVTYKRCEHECGVNPWFMIREAVSQKADMWSEPLVQNLVRGSRIKVLDQACVTGSDRSVGYLVEDFLTIL